MMIFWDARLVLLAVPKTGTQALQAALGGEADMIIRNPPLQKHMPFRWYQRSIHPIFNSAESPPLETVAVIREPIDWLGSWYRYRRRDSLIGHHNSTQERSFADFVSGYLQSRQPAFAAVGRQSRFVRKQDGEIGVDHLFAYEHFPALVRFLETRLGHAISLPRCNVSPGGNLDLPAEIRARATDRLKDEFDLHRLAVRSSGRETPARS